MSDFTIQNIGATVQAYDNGDGTYTVTTKGTKCGEEPTTEIMDTQEVEERYSKYTNDSSEEDIFASSENSADKKEDFMDALDDFCCMINPFYCLQKHQMENLFNLPENLQDILSEEKNENTSFWDGLKALNCLINPWAAWSHYQENK